MKTTKRTLGLAAALVSFSAFPLSASPQDRPGDGLPPELSEARRVTQGQGDANSAQRAAWKAEIERGLAEQAKADDEGRLGELRILCEKSVAEAESPVGRYLLGRLLGKLGTKGAFDERLLSLAREEFLRSLEIDGRFVYGHEGLALCAVFAGDVERAVTEYREVLKDCPDHHAARMALARLLIAQGAVREARDQFAAVPDGVPDWEEARIGEAECELRLGDAAAAAARFRTVLRKEPDHLRASYGLAQTLVAAGRGEEAERVYAEILKKRPDEIVADFFLARLEVERGDAVAAAARLEALVDRAERRIERGEVERERLPLDLGRVRQFLDAVKSGKAGGPHPKSVADVVQVLESSPDAEERRRALRTLSRVQSADVFKPIVRALLDPDHGVRILAVREVADRGGPDAARVIRNLLKDENALVRAAAASALGRVKNPIAAEALIGALRDADPDVVETAVRALASVTGREDPILFETSPTPELREKSVREWEEWWKENRGGFPPG